MMDDGWWWRLILLLLIMFLVLLSSLPVMWLLLLLSVSLLLRIAACVGPDQMSPPFVERLSLFLGLISNSDSPKPISPQIVLSSYYSWTPVKYWKSDWECSTLKPGLLQHLPSFLIIFTLRTQGSLARALNSYLLELKNEPGVGIKVWFHDRDQSFSSWLRN